MAKYPVTQREWIEVMGNNPSNFMGDDLHVEQVSWFAAIEFCNRLSQKEGLAPAYTINRKNVNPNRSANGYRLPTEAEWEYAARGGNGSPGNFKYSGSNNVDEVAWYDWNSGKKTHLVGEKKANGLGLYDMSGNVWEWCWDWYGDYTGSAQTDPVGISSGSIRVLRGGDWGHSDRVVRSALRGYDNPSNRNSNIGFRLVLPPIIGMVVADSDNEPQSKITQPTTYQDVERICCESCWYCFYPDIGDPEHGIAPGTLSLRVCPECGKDNWVYSVK
jgi:formylglycine-generating enzyme required for sulfatase activity/rubredoxin